MKDKFFLDTNIFAYSFDFSFPHKQKIAQSLIAEALESKMGCISFQVIQEFFNIALKKFETPLSGIECNDYLQNVFVPLWETYPSASLFQEALQLKKQTGYSWYDAVILAGALEANCDLLYSEDMQHKHQIRNLKIINPFEEK
jgi:predicted nucleic acid-binding protein